MPSVCLPTHPCRPATRTAPGAAEGHAGVGCYSADTFCMDPACRHFHRLAPGGEPPQPRGWLAAAACPAGLVVHGGNSLSNERLGDMFLLHLH